MPATRDMPRPARRRLVRGRSAAAAAGLASAAVLAAAAASAASPASRCVAGGVPLATGPQVLLVKRAAGSRTELWACRRGSRRALRLGTAFRNGTSTSGGARSALTAAAVGGTVAAVGLVEGANGCIYEYGCADAPHPVLRIADLARRTVRRLPLTGVLTALAVGPDGAVAYRVDELIRLSTYRTVAAPGARVELVGRVPARQLERGGHRARDAPRAFGSVPVCVTIGASSWRTSLFTDAKSASYLLPVKAAIRARERLAPGDEVRATIHVAAGGGS